MSRVQLPRCTKLSNFYSFWLQNKNIPETCRVPFLPNKNIPKCSVGWWGGGGHFFFVILWFTFAFKGPLERIPEKIQSHVKITVKYHRDKNIPECCGIPKRMIQKGTKK